MFTLIRGLLSKQHQWDDWHKANLSFPNKLLRDGNFFFIINLLSKPMHNNVNVQWAHAWERQEDQGDKFTRSIKSNVVQMIFLPKWSYWWPFAAIVIFIFSRRWECFKCIMWSIDFVSINIDFQHYHIEECFFLASKYWPFSLKLIETNLSCGL